MNQRRYIEHNLFLQSSNSKYINQVLLNISIKSCESSYSTSYSSLTKVLRKFLPKYLTPILRKSYSSLTQVLLKSRESSNMTPYTVYITKSCETLAQNISPRNFNEFGNTFFYS